ncbi:MAG: hypothetical protein KAH57_06005 [Thermoplasmata archaeon]|nr:hypothetical protein [Thermoplasmata archaeon]
MARDVTRQVASASIILAVLFAGITYLTIQGDDDEKLVTINLSDMELDLRGLTRDTLQGRSDNQENLTSDLMEDITQFILSREMEGIRSLAIEDVKVVVIPTTIAVDIPTQTPLFKDSRGITVLNSLMYGSSGPSPMIPGTSADVSISLKAIDLDGNAHSERISFSATSYDPEDSLNALLDSIEIDVNTWSSGLARDVEYMLNTLARTRTTRGIGTGPMDVPRNVINEGDVELVLNIAVAVRIARWTGQYPADLVDNIDKFFSDQTHRTTMNPTGFRPWGEAEKENFASYSSSRPASAWKARKVSELLDDILDAGHGDIADIMFNYLYLDGIDENLHIQNPLDEAGPLQISSMSNPRQQYDTVEPYSLATHVTFPSSEGIRIATTGDLTPYDHEGSIMIPKLDLRGDYLVSGRDFILDGINDMDAWFTDVDYTKTMNYYTAYARNTSVVNTSGTSTGNRSSPEEIIETRCGSILPPPAPPNHDWRLQWDLRLDGEMTLDGTISGWGGNIPHSEDVERSIPFGFDIRVHTWFFNGPSNEDAFNFENINDPFSSVTYNETASWLIFTPEANATEFFEDMPYQRLREGFEVLVSLDRTVTQLMRDPTLGEVAKRETAQVLAMGGIKQFREWSQRSGIAGNLTRFKDEYITGKITFSDLGAIRVDGMYATFSYSHSLDRLEIEMDLPEGRVVLSAIGISVPPVRFEGTVVTGAGLTLSLNSGDGTFIISGSIDGHTFTEGPGRISAPPGAVTALMIDTDWTITAPYREFKALGTSSPIKAGFDDRGGMELSYAYVISGEDDMDPKEMIPLLSDAEPHDVGGGYTELFALGMSIASSLDSMEGKPWLGLSVRYEGEDAEPFSRTIWFLPSDDTTYMGVLRDKSIQNTMINMLWVNAIDLPEYVDGSIRADVILTKETTTDNIPLQHEVRATDIIILSHISLSRGNDISLWTFTQNDPSISPYIFMSDDWSRSAAPDTSPLW